MEESIEKNGLWDAYWNADDRRWRENDDLFD